jgi:hypothetical protein
LCSSVPEISVYSRRWHSFLHFFDIDQRWQQAGLCLVEDTRLAMFVSAASHMGAYRMFKSWMRWGVPSLAAAALTVASAAGWQNPAFAGSDNSSPTYAGDINALALPSGTFVVMEYLGYRHADEYVTSPGNFFSKLGGGLSIKSNEALYTEMTRLAYFGRLWDHPLVFEAMLPYVNVQQINVGDQPRPIGGFGPQTVADGFTDPSLSVTYGLISNPEIQRFLAFTNYVYFPSDRYDNFKQFNTSTAGQYTWVPQLSYAEGLGKYYPGMKNLWIDVIANASIHTDGSSPLALAHGVQFDKVTQDNSYDLKAFLRYDYTPGGRVAIGLEKSWGGDDQIASGGILQTLFGGPTSLGKDEFLKGHLQLTAPLSADFQTALDLTHDFERVGGFKEDFTAELRLTKIFLPYMPEPLK